MNPTLQKQIKEAFLQTNKDLSEVDKLDLFLNDLLGTNEFEKIYKKLAIAYWIKKGRDNQNIKNNLKVTDKDIFEVKKIMNKPGIKLALKYLEADEWANVWSDRIKNITHKNK